LAILPFLEAFSATQFLAFGRYHCEFAVEPLFALSTGNEPCRVTAQLLGFLFPDPIVVRQPRPMRRLHVPGRDLVLLPRGLANHSPFHMNLYQYTPQEPRFFPHLLQVPFGPFLSQAPRL
jgi:hypothetical protein